MVERKQSKGKSTLEMTAVGHSRNIDRLEGGASASSAVQALSEDGSVGPAHLEAEADHGAGEVLQHGLVGGDVEGQRAAEGHVMLRQAHVQARRYHHLAALQSRATGAWGRGGWG